MFIIFRLWRLVLLLSCMVSYSGKRIHHRRARVLPYMSQSSNYLLQSWAARKPQVLSYYELCRGKLAEIIRYTASTNITTAEDAQRSTTCSTHSPPSRLATNWLRPVGLTASGWNQRSGRSKSWCFDFLYWTQNCNGISHFSTTSYSSITVKRLCHPGLCEMASCAGLSTATNALDCRSNDVIIMERSHWAWELKPVCLLFLKALWWQKAVISRQLSPTFSDINSELPNRILFVPRSEQPI